MASGARGEPTAEVRERFRNQKTRDTTPEIRLRKLLHAQGFRYRINHAIDGLPRRTIDIAFTRLRLAVFIDGCFWHGCPKHFVPPKKNGSWWADKIARNKERDEETNAYVRQQGWVVLRFWEHDLPSVSLEAVTAEMERIKSESDQRTL